VTWSMPRLFVSIAHVPLIDGTHSCALCISSSVADMNSVLDGQLSICGLVGDVPSKNKKLHDQRELRQGSGHSHMEASAGIS
jgi:hypothetical protein